MRTQPPGANIRINGGDPVARTPAKIRVKRGRATLSLHLRDHETVTLELAIGRSPLLVHQALNPTIQPARLSVSGDERHGLAGARIVVDGMDRGTPPAVIDVAPGRHLLELKKPGFIDFSQWFDLAPAERVAIAPQLVPVPAAKGVLLVTADEAGAKVDVDGGAHKGVVPFVLTSVNPGLHVVEVQGSAGKKWRSTVAVRSKATAAVTAQVRVKAEKPKNGGLFIDASAQAQVRLDGVLLQQKTPVVLDEIAPGSHDIELTAEGKRPFVARVDVAPGKRANVKAKLAAIPTPPAQLSVIGLPKGARLWINRKEVPVGDRVAHTLKAGSHRIQATAPGRVNVAQSVEVVAGRHYVVHLALALVPPPPPKPKPVAVAPAPKPATPPAAAPAAAAPTRKAKADGSSASKPTASTPSPSSSATTAATSEADTVSEPPDSGTALRTGNTAVVRLDDVQRGPSEVSATQADEIDLAESGGDYAISTLGARVLGTRQAAVSLATGYPYWIEVRGVTGFFNRRSFGLDHPRSAAKAVAGHRWVPGGHLRRRGAAGAAATQRAEAAVSPRPGTGLPDEDLVRRSQRGDNDAFHILAARYEAWLVRYLIYLLGHRGNAEDVAQETLVRAYRHIGDFRGGSVQGWLRRIATRLAFNHGRDRKTRRRYEDASVASAVTVSAPDDLGNRDAVLKVPGRLAYPYREIVLLYHVEELSIVEIADLLGIGKSAAKMRLSRARAQFFEVHEEITSDEPTEPDRSEERPHGLLSDLRRGVVAVSSGFRAALRERIEQEEVPPEPRPGGLSSALLELVNLFVRSGKSAVSGQDRPRRDGGDDEH